MKCPKCGKSGNSGEKCSKCGAYIPLSDQQLAWMREHEEDDSQFWGSFCDKLHLRRRDYDEKEINQAFGKLGRCMNERAQLLLEVEFLREKKR